MEKHEHFRKIRGIFAIVGMAIGGVIIAAAMALILGFVVMWLWNWLMPEIFGLGTITYWQGFGIFFLAKILFGFGGDHSSDSNKSKKKEKTIRSEIGDEIRAEIRKEFKKEFDKEYDDKYEEWWENEGKGAFEVYMNKEKETDEE